MGITSKSMFVYKLPHPEKVQPHKPCFLALSVNLLTFGCALFLNCDSGTPGFIPMTLTFSYFYLILGEQCMVAMLQSARAAMS